MSTPRLKTYSCQLYPLRSGQDSLKPPDVFLGPLVDYLTRRHTISNPANQYLRYKTSNGNFALQDDDEESQRPSSCGSSSGSDSMGEDDG